MHISKEELDPGPLIHYCFFLHSLPSWFSNCLNLPFETQVKSPRLKFFFFFYKQEMVGWGEGNMERLLCPGGPHRALIAFRFREGGLHGWLDLEI